jgi:hypothetical protein
MGAVTKKDPSPLGKRGARAWFPERLRKTRRKRFIDFSRTAL